MDKETHTHCDRHSDMTQFLLTGRFGAEGKSRPYAASRSVPLPHCARFCLAQFLCAVKTMAQCLPLQSKHRSAYTAPHCSSPRRQGGRSVWRSGFSRLLRKVGVL